ncbi:MAG: anthranilate synthase component I family protein [Rickettsiales bacterium]
MSWVLQATLPWQEPPAFAEAFAGSDMALLYSGLRDQASGRYSYLFVDVMEVREDSEWAQLPALPTQGDALPLWVGYLGYGMRETRERGGDSTVHLPDFRLVRYGTMYQFDHEMNVISHYCSLRPGSVPQVAEGQSIHLGQEKKDRLPRFPRNDVKIQNLASNLSRSEYESIVTDTIEHIRAGDFYQANITRKFFGKFAETPDSWQIYTKLCAASPAPYSAYIRNGHTAILSSSPECFLSVDTAGMMVTRPIKGSARRSEDASEDTKIREALARSRKNHAENLMIVDLMRNDLSRVAEPTSVKVTEQSGLYSYATIHHLISTITAQKKATVNVYEAVRACFPAGSMTGAPKIAAVKWCGGREKLERGVYSGAIGWFGANDTCDLSVVIRTLIIEGERFEFQVGGGIVADSTPEDEWRETITKARGILAALGLAEEELVKL